jgi:hypothetical protein
MGDPLIAGHPDDILTAAYLDGGLAPPDRDRFEAHLAQCEHCRDGVTLLRSVEGEGPAVPAELVRRARAASGVRTGFGRRGWLLGMAASVALIAAITAGVLRLGPGGRETGSPVRGDAAVFTGLSPSGGGAIPASGLLFQWSAVDGADRYELSLFDATGRRIGQVSAGREATSAPWPLDAPPPAPGSYVWKIRAMALDRIIVESDPISFEVGP